MSNQVAIKAVDLTPEKLKSLGNADFNQVAVDAWRHKKTIDLVLGAVLKEARSRYSANVEFGTWLKNHLPEVSSQDCSRYIKSYSLTHDNPDLLLVTKSVRMELIYAPQEVVENVARTAASGKTQSKAEVREEVAKAKAKTMGHENQMAAINQKPSEVVLPIDAAMEALGLHPLTQEAVDVIGAYLISKATSDAAAATLEAHVDTLLETF